MGGLTMSYVNGFGYKLALPPPEERDPAALRARGRGIRQEALARAAARVGRDRQADGDREAPRAPGGRPRRALRRRAGGVPPSLPRPPRRDDHAAHALHRERGRPDRRLPRAPLRLDGRAAGGAARPDARRLPRLGGSLGGAGAARRRAPRRHRCARTARVDRRPGQRARRAARARRRNGRGDVRLSRPRRQPSARRVRHLGAVRRSSFPTRCCARSGPRSRAAPRRATSTSRSPASARRFPRSTARRSTSCSAKRG